MSTDSPTQLLHAHIGSPRYAECVDIHSALCWVCAGPTTRALARSEWAGASFTGQTRVRAPSSVWVCEACVYICSRLSPVPGRPPAEGKSLGGNFRNYSHLYEAGAPTTYINASKGDKPVILAFLRRPKTALWWAAVADSGQKHVIPWAPINGAGAGGRVLFDEQVVALPDAAGWTLVDDLRALLTAGATKEEIADARYNSGTWERCRGAVEAFEAAWGSRRHGAWFGLALWLAQRDEEAVKARCATETSAKEKKRGSKREAADAHRGDAPVPAGRVPRGGGQPAEALGSTSGPDAVGGAPSVDPGGVGNAHGEGAAPAHSVQLGLPGLA